MLTSVVKLHWNKRGGRRNCRNPGAASYAATPLVLDIIQMQCAVFRYIFFLMGDGENLGLR